MIQYTPNMCVCVCCANVSEMNTPDYTLMWKCALGPTTFGRSEGDLPRSLCKTDNCNDN